MPEAGRVDVSDSTLRVGLVDARTVSVPLLWFPRLAHGSPAERANRRLIGCGVGIHWPDLDDDISVAGLLAGKPSGESQRSLQRWLESRRPAHDLAGVQVTYSVKFRGRAVVIENVPPAARGAVDEQGPSAAQERIVCGCSRP